MDRSYQKESCTLKSKLLLLSGRLRRDATCDRNQLRERWFPSFPRQFRFHRCSSTDPRHHPYHLEKWQADAQLLTSSPPRETTFIRAVCGQPIGQQLHRRLFTAVAPLVPRVFFLLSIFTSPLGDNIGIFYSLKSVQISPRKQISLGISRRL